MRFRLTKAAKVLIMLAVILCVVGGIFFAVKGGLIENNITDKDTNVPSNNEQITVTPMPSGPSDGPENSQTNAINLSLDEWIGWKSIIDANGGLTTKAGSIYDQLGLHVNINVINDATQSSNALIKGDLDAAGYTINRTAFLSTKFKSAGVDVVMPFITNYSNGGDGIIAKSSITKVEDFVNAKIGLAQFSEAHTLVVWFVNNSNLSEADKSKILTENLVYFETPDEAAKAFFAGKVDAAATWEPYLTQAKNMTDCRIFFSTASSSNLVMDGILFSKAFAEQNPELVDKFIQGALMAADLYATDMNTIKGVMPMFATASDEDIKANCAAARLTTWKDNDNLLNGSAVIMYRDMCNVWKSIGEDADASFADTMFDDTYIQRIAGHFDTLEVSNTNTVTVTEDNQQLVMEMEALLGGHASVKFVADTAKFLDPAAAAAELDKFIEMAKILDGAIIEIAGNTNPVGAATEGAYMLSKQRAETVKNYFVMNGISPDRIIVVGNGPDFPIADSTTAEGGEANRRTDVSFKVIEG